MTKRFTPRSSTQSGQIRIWKGCAPGVARAIWHLQREFASRGPNTRYRSLPRIVQRLVEPALRTCLKAKYGRRADAICITFISRCVTQAIKPSSPIELELLDRMLCWLRRRIPDDTFDSTIDTLREMGRWIGCQCSPRVVPPTKRHLRGEARRTRAVVDFSAFADWPYCEICGHLSELADALVRCGYTQAGDPPVGNPKLCARHKALPRSTVARRKQRFELVLDAIEQELCDEAAFRKWFIDRAWQWEQEQTGKTPIRPEDAMHYAANAVRGIPITSPEEGYARECAYRIALHGADETEFAVAKCLAEGLNHSEIARKLRLSRRTICSRVRKMENVGKYNFTRSSPLLYWWPDQAVIGESRYTLEAQCEAITQTLGASRRINIQAVQWVGQLEASS